MMNLCSQKEVQALLTRHGFRFSKAKGQNFLVESWVPRQIAEASGIDGRCGVLEIGPGVGPLTQQLCLHAGKVVAIEVDTRLKPVLAETMADFDNLELIFGDALKLDLPSLVAEKFQDLRPMACANLPYYITSPILSALLESRCFASITVMVQKELALRICAGAGTPDYSAFTVFCQYYSQPELLFDVPANCFLPRPKVTSAVLQLTARTQPPCPIADEAVFFRVVRASFAQRRKTLLNGLASGFPQLTKAQITQILTQCGLSPTVRGETLSIGGFAAVANAIAALLP